ncbi:hypothetical protein CEXT_250371 [Caerostris extrusa]|uniref:Uncharacterized protein n=1 Tax=Caerostris extrusa TaxID=172846 RepID=A0AAV4QTJ5_CAEEX|nr:hypothetical protein CEXT_250371 [Caerostris extrusa]
MPLNCHPSPKQEDANISSQRIVTNAFVDESDFHDDDGNRESRHVLGRRGTILEKLILCSLNDKFGGERRFLLFQTKAGGEFNNGGLLADIVRLESGTIGVLIFVGTKQNSVFN